MALRYAMQDPVPPDPNVPSPAQDQLGIRCVSTYLGQSADHDLALDEKQGFRGFRVVDDLAEIEQARTPNLDLDSLCGMGPFLHQSELDDDRPPTAAAAGSSSRSSSASSRVTRLPTCPRRRTGSRRCPATTGPQPRQTNSGA